MLIFHSRTLIPLWNTLASIRYSITHRQSTRLLFHPTIPHHFLRKIDLLLSKLKDFYVTWLIPHRGVPHFSFTRKGIRLYIYVYPSHSYYPFIWAETRTRTGDLFSTNELLYQLSHFGNLRLWSYQIQQSFFLSATKIELYSISGNSFR